MGLQDISYLREKKNVNLGIGVKVLRNDSSVMESSVVQPGLYSSEEALLRAFKELDACREILADVSLHHVYNHVTIKVKNIPLLFGITGHLAVMLGWVSHPITDVLWFEPNKIYVSPSRVDTFRLEPKFAYIYTIIVSSSIVGDVYAPLLRIFPTEKEHISFRHVQYISISQAHHLNTILLRIKDETGRDITLVSNSTPTITLHVKRS